MTDSIEDKNTLGNQNEEAEHEEKSCHAPNTETTSCDLNDDEPKLGHQNKEAEQEKSCLVPNTATSSDELTDQTESKIDLPKDEDEMIHETAESDDGPSITQVVFGTDDRVKVDDIDIRSYPYKYVCRLVMDWSDSWWDDIVYEGTGWICNTGSSKYDVVVTSAHNLVKPSEKTGGAPKWAKSVKVIPACNGTNHPAGEYTVDSGQLRASANYLKGGPGNDRNNYDFGAILIPKSYAIGAGLPMWVMNSPQSAPVMISGYPGSDGPGGKSPGGYQWKESGIVEGKTPFRLVYSIDTSPGQSGSPILLYDSNAHSNYRVCIGIHRGATNYQVGERNDGIWITQSVYDQINKWGQ